MTISTPRVVLDIWSSLANATGERNAAALNLIKHRVGTAAIRRAYGSYGDLIRAQIPGAQEILEEWSARADANMWHPAIGVLHSAVKQKNVDTILRSVIDCTFLAQAHGMPGNWSYSIENSASFWFSDYLLPPGSEGYINCDSSRLAITLLADGAQNEVAFVRAIEDASWCVSKTCSLELACTSHLLGPGQGIQLLPGEFLEGALSQRSDIQIVDREQQVESQSQVQIAFQLLADHAPEYLDWVACAARYLILLDTPEERMVSVSTSHHSGVVWISLNHEPAAIAEMLIHESSHQLFYLANKLGRVENQTDLKYYYSPFARDQRRIDKILLGFHAFANIIGFHRKLLKSDCSETTKRFCEKRIDELLPDVLSCHEILQQSVGLTEFGETLWRTAALQLEVSLAPQIATKSCGSVLYA